MALEARIGSPRILGSELTFQTIVPKQRFSNVLAPQGFADHVMKILTAPEFRVANALSIGGGIEIMDGS